jgi:hypothetical protein
METILPLISESVPVLKTVFNFKRKFKQPGEPSRSGSAPALHHSEVPQTGVGSLSSVLRGERQPARDDRASSLSALSRLDLTAKRSLAQTPELPPGRRERAWGVLFEGVSRKNRGFVEEHGDWIAAFFAAAVGSGPAETVP